MAQSLRGCCCGWKKIVRPKVIGIKANPERPGKPQWNQRRVNVAQSTVTQADLGKIVSAAMDAVTKVAAQPNQMSVSAVADSKSDIKAEMKDGVASVIAHVTNNEPWYQSRVTLGSLAVLVAMAAGLLGYSIEPETQGKVIDAIIQVSPLVVAAAGSAFSLYGRWAAKKPLGS
jgi:hypothetical protein